MYAFAPTTTSKMCGVPDATSPSDLNLHAQLNTPTTINLSGTTALSYTQGG